MFIVFKTDEFVMWFDSQTIKTKIIIEARIDRLKEGHWGVTNRFDGLIELKWVSGLRVYRHFLKRTWLLYFLEEIKMVKQKISRKLKTSSVATLKKHKLDKKLFLDKKMIAEILVEALLQNDLATFRDVLITHLKSLSKTDLSRKTGLGRRTLYDLIENERFDPRLSTIGSLLSKLAA